MNKIQKDTVSLLNAAIHGKKIDFDINKNIDWNGIMEESKAHNVEALIYSAIGNNTLKGIDKGLVETWKKETFMSGVYQLNHIRQIHGVLYEFNKYNMPVIALKGLVLRDLYPKKELRTMGDADILVREEDLDKIKQILLDLGYEEGIISPRDISFKKGNTYIEVHWRVNHKDSFQNVEDFEKKVWENVIDVEFKGSRALSMNEDDLIIHLCMHMAKHIKTSGFGIRQLADLVLLVEQKFDLINWDQVYNKSKKYGIYKFMVVIFMICNKLFEMNIPNIFNDKNTVDSEYLNILIDKIFSNGVH